MDSNQVLLVNKQFPSAEEITEYGTALCMYFPEMPQDLLKQNDAAVIFGEQYTPFLLEIDFEENEMYLSQRDLPKMEQYLEDQCKCLIQTASCFDYHVML